MELAKAEDVGFIRAVVLEDHVHQNIVVHPLAVVFHFHLADAGNGNRLFIDDILVHSELADELHDAFLVVKRLTADGSLPFVDELNDQPGVQEGKLAQAGRQAVELEFRSIRENGGVREEGDGGSRYFTGAAAHHAQWFRRLAAFKLDLVALAVAADFRLEPVRQGIHAFGAHPVETAGIFVGPLAELASRMQVGQHQFHSGNAEFGVHIHRNAAPVVHNGNGTVHVDYNVNLAAVAGQVLVNGVIQNFKYTMVQAALIRVPNVHAGPLPHSLQAFQFINLRGAVFMLRRRGNGGFNNLVGIFGHN